MTSKLKRLFIVTDISQSGMCGEEGRYPPVYVPIAKVASPLSLLPLPDSLPSIAFHGHKGAGGLPHGGVAASPPRGKCRLFRGEGAQCCSWPSPPPLPLLARQNHRFHLVAGLGGLGSKHDAEGDVMSTDAGFQVTLYFGVIWSILFKN